MSENLYATPLAPMPNQFAPAIDTNLYRLDDLLVFDKNAVLPDELCLKSTTKASGKLRRNLTWHHPAVFLALLANILIYALLAIVLSKKATIYIGLSDEWFAKRRRRIAIAWAAILLSLGTLIGGVVVISSPAGDDDVGAALMISGFFGFLAAALYGLLAPRLVSPKKITDSHVYPRRVHPDFLARLKHWPYGS